MPPHADYSFLNLPHVMKPNFLPPIRVALFVGVLALLAAPVSAQFFPQPGGGGGGGTSGRSGRSGGSGAGARDYQNNTEIGQATISSDPEARKIIIVTDDETNLQIKEIISNLDRPKPQVLIKVVFVEIQHNKASDIGLEGGFGRNLGGGNTGSVVNAFGLSGLNTAATGAVQNAFGQGVQSFAAANPITAPGAGLYQILGRDFQVTLRAIAQAGNAEVVSRPSILARNNQPATITVGKSVPLITNVRFDSLGNQISSIAYTDVGVILKVTPFITKDGLVEMIIAPELSSVSQTDQQTIANGVTAPAIDKRSADTVVVTPDGQTVVVGGLMGRSRAQNDTKIPILGDIPWLGNLFKRKTKSDVKTELIIFLTPHIIQAPTQLAAVSAAEVDKMPLTPKQFSADELNKFLEGLPVRPTPPEDAKNEKGEKKPAPPRP